MIKNLTSAALIVAFLVGSAFAGNDSSASDLTQEQKDTLLFIYQEEKVARDAYITLGTYYPNQTVYANIQLSEQKHMDSAQALCDVKNTVLISLT